MRWYNAQMLLRERSWVGQVRRGEEGSGPAEGHVGLRRRTGARTGVSRPPAFHLHLVRRLDVGNHAGRGRGRLGGVGGVVAAGGGHRGR